MFMEPGTDHTAIRKNSAEPGGQREHTGSYSRYGVKTEVQAAMETLMKEARHPHLEASQRMMTVSWNFPTHHMNLLNPTTLVTLLWQVQVWAKHPSFLGQSNTLERLLPFLWLCMSLFFRLLPWICNQLNLCHFSSRNTLKSDLFSF